MTADQLHPTPAGEAVPAPEPIPPMTPEERAWLMAAADLEDKYPITAGWAALAAIAEGRADPPPPPRYTWRNVASGVVAGGAVAAVLALPSVGTLGAVAVVAAVVGVATVLFDHLDRRLYPPLLPPGFRRRV